MGSDRSNVTSARSGATFEGVRFAKASKLLLKKMGLRSMGKPVGVRNTEARVLVASTPDPSGADTRSSERRALHCMGPADASAGDATRSVPCALRVSPALSSWLLMLPSAVKAGRGDCPVVAVWGR